MATTERDLLDRLVTPQGVGGTAALLGASLTPGVSTAVDAASFVDAIRKRDALTAILSGLGMAPFISGTTVRVGGEATGRGIKSLVENLYHGSPNLFRKFRRPSRGGLYGVGQYLTDRRKTAEAYAANSGLRSVPTVERADMIDADKPLGYIYDVNIRAPESSFIEYHSRDIASQPKGLQKIYEELEIPETMSFDDLRRIGSADQEVRAVAERVRNLARERGFRNWADLSTKGGLESLLRSRGVSGVKVDPNYFSQGIEDPERYYVVFGENMLDIVGKPTPVYPRVRGALEAGQPRSFASARQLNQYLKNK